MNSSSRLMLALSLVTVSGMLRAVDLVGLPRVEVQGTAAIVRWNTDSESGSRVHFGTEAGKLVRRADGQGVGTEHVVVLEGLEPGITYHFSVGTSRRALATGSFTTAGRPVAPEATRSVENSRGVPTPSKRNAPATRRIWGTPASLQDHFDRHGSDFGAKDPADYARKSWEFLQRAIDEGLPAKVDDSDGTIRVWDPKTRAFAAYNRDGTTKTFFKPDSSSYFERQPGRPMQLKRKE